MPRLDPQPGEVIDRRLDLRFQFDRKTFQAHPGDTIGSALAASDTDIFSRSFKYHRPRGLLCVSGKCPNCLMNVNGVPNVRVCAEPVRQGDRITSQHRWPSLRWDLFSVIEKFDRFPSRGLLLQDIVQTALRLEDGGTADSSPGWSGRAGHQQRRDFPQPARASAHGDPGRGGGTRRTIGGQGCRRDQR